MRVIVLNDYGYVNGGAAQVAISSLNALAHAGLDVSFVFGVGPADPSIDRNLVKTIDFGLHDLLGNPSRIHASLAGLWNTTAASRMRELLRDYHPEDTIIHLHGWVKSLSPSIVQTALKLGFKIVCTLHDYFTVCPNGGLYNFPQRKQCSLRPMSIGCISTDCDARNYAQKLWRVSRHAIQDRVGHMPGGLRNFITVSDYSESIMRPLLPVQAHFYRIGNPIAIDKLSPATIQQQATFCFIGRLSPEKGADIFAAAAEVSGVQALFVGAGEEKAKLAATNPSAEFCGWQDREGVVTALQSSRALVFPSLLHETQGMSVLEAAALGIPAIVSDSCAAREAIVDGETGMLFQSGNVSDMAAKLETLQRDRALAARLGLTAYERYWQAPSTIEMHGKCLINCYRQIMDTPN
jgi:glycosyltransferase involved in cell wall biosynthesis